MLFRSFLTVTIAAAALPPLLTFPAVGQTMPQPNPLSPSSQSQSGPQYSIIHVNSVSGSDTDGDGSQFEPLQTISRALRVATPNTIIVLAPGDYTATSGETFPLIMQPGVTLQGTVAPDVGNIVIRGSGTYRAANGTYMQTTLVGVDGSGLGSVTVTNPSSSGYGLVVEAGRPIIRHNHFTGSGYAGAYVGGTAAPRFEHNRFSGNGSVGLWLAEQSRAEVLANTFENTGTGIQISPGAEPRIADNRIVSNRQGIVMAAEAQPQLQNNEILRNRHNGLIEFAAATKTQPPETTLATTVPGPLGAREPLPVSAPGPILSAPLAATSEAMALQSPPPVQPGPLAAPPNHNEPSPEHSSPAGDASSSRRRAVATPPTQGLESTPPTGPVATRSVAALQGHAEAESPGLTAEPPRGAAPDTARSSDGADLRDEALRASGSLDLPASLPLDRTSLSNYAAAEGGSDPRGDDARASAQNELSVPLAVLPPTVTGGFQPSVDVAEEEQLTDPTPTPPHNGELEPIAALPRLPEVASDPNLLRVPEGDIPTGHGAQQIPAFTAASSSVDLSGEEPPPPPSRAAMLGLYYRIVVPASDRDTQTDIKAIVPDAFRVEVDNQTMMQVGAYPSEAEAETMVEALHQEGLEARIIYSP